MLRVKCFNFEMNATSMILLPFCPSIVLLLCVQCFINVVDNISVNTYRGPYNNGGAGGNTLKISGKGVISRLDTLQRAMLPIILFALIQKKGKKASSTMSGNTSKILLFAMVI